MKFYVLKNPEADSSDAVTDFLAVDGSKVGNAPLCPACGKYLGMRSLLPPVRIELRAWGSRWGDIAFGPGDQILISRKLKKLFVESGMVGFASYDRVEIVKTASRKSILSSPPDYLLASIGRSRALLDEAASGLTRDEETVCEECRLGGIVQRVDRIVVEAGTWSSEDVFFARGLPGTILTSARFKNLCEDNELANCRFVPAHDFSFGHDSRKPNNTRRPT